MNEETKIKEQAIDAVSRVYAKNNDANAIKLLVDELKPLFEQMPKAKTAKIICTRFDLRILSESNGISSKKRRFVRSRQVFC